MNIAVQISIPHDTHPNYRLFSKLAATHPELTITYVCDQSFQDCVPFSENESFVTVGPAITTRLSSLLWYKVHLPAWLKKNKPDFFISLDHQCIRSGKVQQVIRVEDPAVIRAGKLEGYLKQACCIITPDNHINESITGLLSGMEEKICCLPPLPDSELKELSSEQQAEVKSVFTDGRDFFLLQAGDETLHNLIIALKAFSIFKKWQQSSMKLVLALDRQQEKVKKEIEHYKYREDVVITHESKIPVLSCAAYAMIITGYTGIIKENMMNALSIGVPLIMKQDSHAEFFFGDSVLYAPMDEKELSRQMMLLYKDESVRKEKIEKGRLLTATTSREETAGKLLQMLVSLTNR